MTRNLITVTHRSKDGARRIQAALAADRHVMAKTRTGWFRATAFREIPVDPTHPEWGVIWEARTSERGRLSARPGFLEVTTVKWFEYRTIPEEVS